MNKYLWYCNATDITGIAIAEALGIDKGKDKPPRNKDLVIGWGAKIGNDGGIGNNVVAINHPDKIKIARNKLRTLELLQNDRDLAQNVAKFTPANNINRAMEGRHPEINLPLIGRKNHHQGGTGLWPCLTKSHVDKAISDGATYFQNFIDINTEYRLHVFGDSVIYASKKSENPAIEGWINQRKEKIIYSARKNDVNCDEPTMMFILKKLAKEATLPDRIIRSNTRGWKFSNVRISSLPTALKNAAIKAVQVVGLDFGAVDCALDTIGHPFIIEINTGPGLHGTSFNKYIDAFRQKISQIEEVDDHRQVRPRNMDAANRAVGAENVGNGIDYEAAFQMMRVVRNEEEARRVLDVLGRRN